MRKQAECLGCDRIVTLTEENHSYRCECGVLSSKKAMIDMYRLRQENLILPVDAWDKTLAKEPTGMSYQEGNQEVTI